LAIKESFCWGLVYIATTGTAHTSEKAKGSLLPFPLLLLRYISSVGLIESIYNLMKK
jgi:hypothetical protein